MIIRELVTKLGFDADNKKVIDFGNAVKGLTIGLAGVVAGATAAATAAFNLAKHASEYGDEIAKTSAELGVSTDNLQIFRFAADRAGTGVDTLNGALRFAQKSLAGAAQGTGPMAEALAKLGLSAVGADGKLKNIDELMPQIADKTKLIASESERAAIMVGLFGRGGGKMALLLKDGSVELDNMGARLREIGGIMSAETAAKAEVLDDALTDFNVAMGALGLTVGGRLMPAVTELTLTFVKLMNPTNALAQQRLDAVFDLLNKAVSATATGLLVFFDVMSKLVEGLGGLEAVLNLVTVALLGFAAFKTVVFMQALIGLFPALIAGMMAFNVAALLNPLVWIPAAVIAVALLAKGIWDAAHGAENWVSKAANGIKSTFMGLMGYLKSGFNALISGIQAVIPDWMLEFLSFGTIKSFQSLKFASPQLGVGNSVSARNTMNNVFNINGGNPKSVTQAVMKGTQMPLTNPYGMIGAF